MENKRVDAGSPDSINRYEKTLQLMRDMKKQGLRPFAVGAIGEVIIAVFTLALVLGAERVLHF